MQGPSHDCPPDSPLEPGTFALLPLPVRPLMRMCVSVGVGVGVGVGAGVGVGVRLRASVPQCSATSAPPASEPALRLCLVRMCCVGPQLFDDVVDQLRKDFSFPEIVIKYVDASGGMCLCEHEWTRARG